MGFFFSVSFTAACAGVMQSSARRLPIFWLMSIDLLPSCSHMAPARGSSRRMAPVRLSTGCIRKRWMPARTMKKPSRLCGVMWTVAPSSQGMSPTNTRLATSRSAGVSVTAGSSSTGVASSTAFCADRASLPFLGAGLAAGLAAGFAGSVDCASASAGIAAISSVVRRNFIQLVSVDLISQGLEPALHFLRQLPCGPVCPLQHLPVIAVACPILQLAFETDGSPMSLGRSSHYFGGNLDLVRAWSERFQDRPDLVRMDAPHPRETKLKGGPFCSSKKGRLVLELRHHAVRRHLAPGVARRSDLELGAHHQRMRELSFDAHGFGWNRAAVGRNEIHQA